MGEEGKGIQASARRGTDLVKTEPVRRVQEVGRGPGWATKCVVGQEGQGDVSYGGEHGEAGAEEPEGRGEHRWRSLKAERTNVSSPVAGLAWRSGEWKCQW